MTKTSKALRIYLATALTFGWTLAVGATSAFAEEPAAPAEPVVVVVTTPGGDDSSYQIPLTTTVTFDGVQYNSVFATTNSVITFGRADGTYWDFPQTPSISLYSMDWVVYPNAREDEHLIIRSSDGGFQVDIAARPIWLQSPSTEVTNINIVAAINVDGTVAISYSLTGPSYEGQTRTGVRLNSGQVVTLEEYGVIQVEEPPVLTPEPVVPTPEPTVSPEPTPTPTPTPTQEPAPSLNAPTNVRVQQLPNGQVEILWDAPATTSTAIERYAVSWNTPQGGWGVAATGTSLILPADTSVFQGGLNTNYSFTVRADNDTLGVYSPASTAVDITVNAPIRAPFIPQGATVLGEGSSLEVIAPAGQRIQSITAWYGDPDDGSRGIEVSSELTQLAGGRTSVTINSDNSFGDPAGGTVKVLIFVVNYEDIVPTPEEIAAAEREERERQERLAAEQAAAEAARLEEQARLAAAEAARIAAEQAAAAEAARVEAERLAAERAAEAARIEAERVAAEAAAAAEAARIEAERLEAERVAAEARAEEARLEAERIAAEQAAKAEAERIAAEEAAEKARLEAEEKARLEAEAEALKPEPEPEPEEPVEEEITSAEELPEVISAELLTKIDLEEIVATDLSTEQAEALKEAALETFETAAPGSEAYEQALDALFVAAAADDIVISEELAAIPGAEALVDAINFMSNVGADMSPEQREESEKVVVAAVVAGNAAIAAATGAASAATSAAASAGGGVSGGSSSGRRIK